MPPDNFLPVWHLDTYIMCSHMLIRCLWNASWEILSAEFTDALVIICSVEQDIDFNIEINPQLNTIKSWPYPHLSIIFIPCITYEYKRVLIISLGDNKVYREQII